MQEVGERRGWVNARGWGMQEKRTVPLRPLRPARPRAPTCIAQVIRSETRPYSNLREVGRTDGAWRQSRGWRAMQRSVGCCLLRSSNSLGLANLRS